jgi:hypothetical protein
MDSLRKESWHHKGKIDVRSPLLYQLHDSRAVEAKHGSREFKL